MKTENFPPNGNILRMGREKSQENGGENFWAGAREQVGFAQLPPAEDGAKPQPSGDGGFSCMWEETMGAIQARLGDKLAKISNCIAYSPAENAYYVQDSKKIWSIASKRQLSCMLRLAPSYKISVRPRYLAGEDKKLEDLSDFDCAMLYIERCNAVNRVVPSLAGYRAGIHPIDLGRLLVLKELELIAPKKGAFATIDALFRHFLDFDQHRQYARLKCLLRGVLQLTHRVYGGQASLANEPHTFLHLFLVGDPQLGKSFIVQQIFQPILGGVIGKPFSLMSGKTEFNEDTARAILQTCDDSVGFSSERDQGDYAQMIKQLHSNEMTRINAKFKEPFHAHLLHFYVSTTNSDPNSLKLFPRLVDGVDGLRQRILALYANPELWSEFAANVTDEQKRKLQRRIQDELPALVHHLLYEFEPAADLVAPSFHCKEFIHPKIEKLNRANTQEGKLKALLWEILGNQEFTGHSTDLHNRILGECGENGMKYVYYCVNQLGVLLSKLCKIYADEFTLSRRHGAGKPTYTIRLKGEDLP